MKKIVLLTAAISSLMLSGCDTGQADDHISNNAIYSSESFTAEAQEKTHKLSAFVEPSDNATLSFQVSGTIDKQFIKIGDVVNKSDPLFNISNPSLGPKIRQIDAEIKAVEATLSQNKSELSRLTDLKKSNAVSQNELDKLTNQNANLLAQKDSLKAQLSEAQSLFDETLLSAPFHGTVAEIYKEKGENIASGEPILLLGGVNSLEAPIYLTSHLQKTLQEGQTFDAEYQNQVLTVSIQEISHAANPKSQLFKVVMNVPMSLGMKSGEQISIQIPEQLGQHFALPISAVVDDGINKPYVLLIENNQVKQVFVTTLVLQGGHILLDLNTTSDNLKQIEVVTEGHAHLSVGQKINAKPTQETTNQEPQS